MKPVLGAVRWYGPQEAQFLKEDRLMITFEDGHVIGAAIFDYDTDYDTFTFVKVFQKDYFSDSEWKDIVKKYGQVDYSPVDYTTHIWRDGKTIDFGDWTLVPENLFLKPPYIQ